jgi:hypothetical protein
MATPVTLPPSYELSTDGSLNELLTEDPLPDYTPRTACVSQPLEEREFEYKVEKKKGETLASLKVVAPATYSKNIPTFCGAGPVKGSVNLYLKEPDTITSVAVSVSNLLTARISQLMSQDPDGHIGSRSLFSGAVKRGI